MSREAREHLNASAQRARMEAGPSSSAMEATNDNPEINANVAEDADNTLAPSSPIKQPTKKRKAKSKDYVTINPRRDRYVPQLDGPRPGGPEKPDLLISYDQHVACYLWANASVERHDHGVLKVHNKPDPIKLWDREGRGRWWDFVKKSGLAHLKHCVHKHIDGPLISAFVER